MKKTSFFLVATCGGFTPPLAALRNSGLCLRRRTRAGLESGLQNLNVAYCSSTSATIQSKRESNDTRPHAAEVNFAIIPRMSPSGK